MRDPRSRFVLAMALLAPIVGLGMPAVTVQSSNDEVRYSLEMDQLRQALAANGSAGIELAQAEIFVSPGEGAEAAHTLIANDRTHLIGSQFVENDPRRDGGSNITYVVDQSDGSVLSFNTPTPPREIITLPNSITEAAIDRSMNTWTQSPNCNGPASIKLADSGGNIDLIDDLVLGGPIGSPTADITHGGWLSRTFFNRIAPPNGGSFILGVTFTFIFLDSSRRPTDIDRNGRADVAFREIYYNGAFGWGVGTLPQLNVDIESIATHEAGHAFGLGHFGKVVFKENTGEFQYSPRAMMNAVYISPFRELVGADTSSFCQVWANSH